MRCELFNVVYKCLEGIACALLASNSEYLRQGSWAVLQTPQRPEVPFQAWSNSATPGKNIWGVAAKLCTARKCHSRRRVNHKRLEMNLVTPTIFSNHNFSNASGPFPNAHLFRSDICIIAES